MKIAYPNVLRGLVLLASLAIVPHAVYGDDTELFSTRANPNVLFMLDTTGSMSTTDPAVPSGSIGDLDGDGYSDTRLDILYKVAYSLLNADLSIPSSTVSFQVQLAAQIKTTQSYSQIQVSCGGDWNSFPSGPGSYQVTVDGPAEQFTYSSKTRSGSGSNRKCYLVLPSNKTFQSPHTSTSTVRYSVGSSFTTPYPLNHVQASGTDYLNNLDNTDESLLKARLGVMRFTTNSTGTADGIDILNQIASTAPNAPRFSPTYQAIWQSIRGLTPGGGTPTAQALNAALAFFNTAYSSTEPCRKNFVVIITDGEDTAGLTGSGKTGGNLGSAYYYKSGFSYDSDYHSGWTFEADGWPGWPSNTGQVARNNQVIQTAAALKSSDRDVTVFSVGVGIAADQPHLRVLRHVLRRAAEQAGTTETNAQFNAIGNGTVAEDNTIAAGRAFFTTDAVELADALHNIFQQITKGTFSYTAPTVLSVRAVDKNEVYTASFEPALPPNTLWRGHLKAFNYISADNQSLRWDAGDVLKATSPGNRNVLTSDNTWVRKTFDTTNILPEDLGLLTGDTAGRNAVVNYVCGVGHTSSSDNNYILGDIFHSKPVLVGAPSKFYVDQGYREFANAKAGRRRVLYAGANDGTMHAFLTGDWDNTTARYSQHDTGAELFAYVPYHLLTQVENFLPTTASSHSYYVDSSPRVADVWWNDNNNIGIKQPSEWHTVLISGMRKGGAAYFALDVTNPPLSSSYIDSNYPKVLWEFSDDTLLGETWSEPIIAKVQEKSSSSSTVAVDRFVAIVGGGVSYDSTIGNTLLVLDVKTGAVLKQFTGIDNQIASSPTAVLDIQGYIRYIFATDLRGNLYKFDFRAMGDAYGSTPYSNWFVNKIFQPASGGQPSYNRAEVATVNADGSQRFIYFGTGDREAPISNTNAGKFFMIMDDDSKTTTTLESQLSNFTGTITSSAGGSLGTSKGWFVVLDNIVSTSNMNDSHTHDGEKVLSDPVVFFNRVYFTTFTPDSSNPCSGGGISRLYGLDWFNGGAGMEPITASPNSESKTGSAPFVPSHVFAGKGLPSSPSLSINPWGQSSLFIGFSDATFTEITVASPPTSKKLRSWQEVN